MTVRGTPASVIVRCSKLDASSIESMLIAAGASAVSNDGHLVSASFEHDRERSEALTALNGAGNDKADIVLFDAAGERETGSDWLRSSGLDNGVFEAWDRARDRDESAPLHTVDRPAFDRHAVLSRSESGLLYVRDRVNGVVRRLTEAEMEDFNDPAPCPRCGEQFGCDHFNCAGEPLLGPDEVRAVVPAQWQTFARDCGISREDLIRLENVREVDGEWRLVAGAESDMRAMELVLLLNDWE